MRSQTPKPSFINRYAAFIISGISLLLLVLAYFFIPSFQAFTDEAWGIIWNEDHEEIQEYFKKFGLWGPLAIVIFIVLQMFLLVFPTWIPIIVAVLAYGFWPGVLINLIGIGISSFIGYRIGDKLEDKVFRGFMSHQKMEKMRFWIHHYGFWTVVLFRISPFLSTDSISFLAGIFEMDFKRFITATYAGMVPLTIAVGYFASDFERLEDGLFWIGGAGIVLYGVYVYLDYSRRKKRGPVTRARAPKNQGKTNKLVS